MGSRSSDIAAVILAMLEETGSAEIQRNVLAQTLGVVPSQISYVIASRFLPEQGYVVESRRGGGGCIRIRRVSLSRGAALLALVNSIGAALDSATLRAHTANLFGQDFITAQSAALIESACSDAALRPVPLQLRPALRAALFKQMLLALQE